MGIFSFIVSIRSQADPQGTASLASVQARNPDFGAIWSWDAQNMVVILPLCVFPPIVLPLEINQVPETLFQN